MTDTRERILETARALFNERGVHRVGVRDVARATEISPGNLAYHFPTKDHLVSALVLELHELDGHEVFAELPATFSLVTLYETALAAMRNLLAYRFVLLSYVDAVTASPELQELEASLRKGRRARHDAIVALLAANGYVDGRAIAARADYLYEIARAVSSGWLTLAALDGKKRDDEAAVRHYAKVGMAVLAPYCTAKGARQMRRVLAGELDPA